MKATIPIILTICAALSAAPKDPEQLRFLQTENKTLRKQLEGVRKELAALRAQVEQLRKENAELRKAVGPANRPGKEAASKPAGYTYRGRRVSQKWFEARYKEFNDKIVLLKGKFYDAGKARLEKPCIWKKPPGVGALRWTIGGSSFRRARILQAIGEDQALVQLTMRGISGGGPAMDRPERTMLIHVKGVDPKRNVDDSPFPDLSLVYVGRYTYIAASRARKTVQDYRTYQPLTRKQFTKALAGGFQLIAYKVVEKRVKERVAVGGGFSPRTVERTVIKKEIVATPIR